MMKFLADKNLTRLIGDGTLTYIQALEMHNMEGYEDELKLPNSARERNLLNVLARLPAALPLRSTMMVVDISQAIDRCYPKTDGTLPNACNNSKIWSIRAGRALDAVEMAKLMGHELDEIDLKGITECQMRKMLAHSTHLATAGFVLIGLLAAVGSSVGSSVGRSFSLNDDS